MLHLIAPGDEELREAMIREPSGVAVLLHDDVAALRYALAAAHIAPAAPLVVTIFDQTVSGQLARLLPRCHVTSAADLAAATLVGPCLAPGALAIRRTGAGATALHAADHMVVEQPWALGRQGTLAHPHRPGDRSAAPARPGHPHPARGAGRHPDRAARRLGLADLRGRARTRGRVLRGCSGGGHSGSGDARPRSRELPRGVGVRHARHRRTHRSLHRRSRRARTRAATRRPGRPACPSAVGSCRRRRPGTGRSPVVPGAAAAGGRRGRCRA